MSLRGFGTLVLVGGVIAALLSNYDIKISITVRKKEEKSSEKMEKEEGVEIPVEEEKENSER